MQESIIIFSIILGFLACCLFILNTVKFKKVQEKEIVSFSEELEKVQNFSEKSVLEDSRYVTKKASRVSKDVNRFGRWKCTLKNGHVVTRVGALQKVIKSDVKTYQEIK